MINKFMTLNLATVPISFWQYDNIAEASNVPPTKENILRAFRWLMEGCQPGHSLVFFYFGRSLGSLRPVDYETQGEISNDEINAAIVKPLPDGAKLHAIIDTCHSGTFLGLPFMYKLVIFFCI